MSDGVMLILGIIIAINNRVNSSVKYTYKFTLILVIKDQYGNS